MTERNAQAAGFSAMMTTDEMMAAGWSAFRAGDLEAAVRAYRGVVSRDPSVARAWYMLGALDQVRGRVAQCVSSYERAIALQPDFAEALNNLGVALHALKGNDEAKRLLERALVLDPSYAEAHNNLGNVLHERGLLDLAAASYRQAIALRPGYVDAQHNLGNVLRSAGRTAEAIACYDLALAWKPDHPHVHLSRSMALLESGDFRRGWPEYEWRLKCGPFAVPALPGRAWDGGPLDGRTLLLYADHGLGDAIQFIRYAGLTRERARPARIVVACRPPLERLLTTAAGVDQATVEGALLPTCDAHAPLMSLPGIFGTEASTIPADIPYLFADPELMATWGRGLPQSSGCRIGIVWQGNPGHMRDSFRSFRLEQLEPIARQPGVTLISLQRDHGREQIAQLDGRFPVSDKGGELRDLMDAAALMKNLDLVIAADTALAHLAGALGIPVWLALSSAPDWRWMRDRDDSPWYPTMRLFRQRRLGDWDELFARMADALTGPPRGTATVPRSD